MQSKELRILWQAAMSTTKKGQISDLLRTHEQPDIMVPTESIAGAVNAALGRDKVAL